jgi:hypothetical protein
MLSCGQGYHITGIMTGLIFYDDNVFILSCTLLKNSRHFRKKNPLYFAELIIKFLPVQIRALTRYRICAFLLTVDYFYLRRTPALNIL